MKIIALDIGDVHTGVAYADDLGILAAPYKTVATNQLMSFLAQMVSQGVQTVVVGQPKTLKGSMSEQTYKVMSVQQTLAQQYPHIKWILWDERLTSKQARDLVAKKIKRNKEYEHEVAAAIILQSYLDALSHEK